MEPCEVSAAVAKSVVWRGEYGATDDWSALNHLPPVVPSDYGRPDEDELTAGDVSFLDAVRDALKWTWPYALVSCCRACQQTRLLRCHPVPFCGMGAPRKEEHDCCRLVRGSSYQRVSYTIEFALNMVDWKRLNCAGLYGGATCLFSGPPPRNVPVCRWLRKLWFTGNRKAHLIVHCIGDA